MTVCKMTVFYQNVFTGTSYSASVLVSSGFDGDAIIMCLNAGGSNQYIIGRINIYAIGTGYIFQCTDIDSIYSEAICVKYMKTP